MRGRREATTIGLTSAANVAFVESLGLFDKALAYDRLDEMPPAPTVYVDFSGSNRLRQSLRDRLGMDLAYDCAVGVADWTAQRSPPDWAGVQPKVFFAPAHYVRMLETRGAPAFWRTYAEAWRQFRTVSERWYQIIELNGLEALQATYQRFVAGEVDPAQGVVVRV